jgi:ribosomal protein S18 acetylase RimI-like enzyme
MLTEPGDSSLSRMVGLVSRTLVEIERVRPDEYAAAGAVTRAAYEEFAPQGSDGWPEYRDRIGDIAGRAARTVVLVARSDGAIVASATVELDERIEPERDPVAADEAHIRMLGVGPRHRRRGIGRALVEACIDVARTHGRRRVTLETTEEMVAAQALYASMGFRSLGSREVMPSLCFRDFELVLEDR